MITVKCQTCGKSIKKYPSHAKKGRGKFCSKECYYGERRRKPTIFSRGMNPYAPRKPYIPYKHITF